MAGAQRAPSEASGALFVARNSASHRIIARCHNATTKRRSSPARKTQGGGVRSAAPPHAHSLTLGGGGEVRLRHCRLLLHTRGNPHGEALLEWRSGKRPSEPVPLRTGRGLA